MRAKFTRRRRHVDGDGRQLDDDLIPASQSPERWLLANEAGWGIPHGPLEMLAALVAGYATVGLGRWVGGRLGARRRSQPAERGTRTPRVR